MCFEVDKCCFCVDVTTATRAIALVEATVAAPLVVRGVAELDCSCRGVVLLVAGHVLALSAWALFDGALLRRRGLLAGWLVVTVLKSALLFGMGVLYAFLVDNSDALADISDALGAYFSRCVFSITRHNAGKLFHVVYTIAYFASGFLYMYCFSVVYSFRKTIKKSPSSFKTDYEKRKRHGSSSSKRRRALSSSSTRRHHSHSHSHHRPKVEDEEYETAVLSAIPTERNQVEYGGEAGINTYI